MRLPVRCSPTSQTVMTEHILREQLDFTHPLWANVSDSAKHLIQQLCQKDVSARYDVERLLAHPWLTGETASDAVLAGSDERLGEFNMQALANIAWTFAKVSQPDVQLFTALARTVERYLGAVNAQELANTA